MARVSHGHITPAPATILEQTIQRALDIAKKARKYKQKLTSDNFYANKLAELRAAAVNAFQDLSSQSAGDVSAMAEMIEAVFSSRTNAKKRADTARELIFSLRTTWRDQKSVATHVESDTLFPTTILAKTNRGYLITIGRQMNGCFSAGWYDGCAVMMRRLLEIALIEACESKQLTRNIKDKNGNYLQLTALIDFVLDNSRISLSRNAKKSLPQLRDLGHTSAHGRYFTAQKDDVERLRKGCRIALEELLHHAGLL